MRVAAVPDDHPYVAAVLPPDVTRVRFGDPSLPWAPSPLFDESVLRSAEVDVIHVHFGFESQTPAALARWLDVAHARGIAVVVTVHDLRNPHELDDRLHAARLAVLVGGADAVSTLTPGAAAEILRRFGRIAAVLPHPPLVEHPAAARESGTVGIHLKSLRTNVAEPARLVAAAARGARAAGAVLRVDAHPEVADHPELIAIRALGEAGELELRVHQRYDDAALTRYLSRLAVSVLPYRFGTHSGWLELCRELGTKVVVPDCGYYAEQWPAAVEYGNNERTGLDDDSLAAAVETAVLAPLPATPEPQLAEIRRAHGELYRCAVGVRLSAAVAAR